MWYVIGIAFEIFISYVVWNKDKIENKSPIWKTNRQSKE